MYICRRSEIQTSLTLSLRTNWVKVPSISSTVTKYPIPYSPFFVLYSLLPVNCSPFFLSCFLFPVLRFLFHVPCSSFPVPCWSVPVPRSLFFIFHFLFPLSISHSPFPFSLLSVHRALFFSSPFLVPCSLFPVLYFLFPVPCSLFSVLRFLFSLPHSLFPVVCSLWSVPCFLLPVVCSLFSVPFSVSRSLFLFPVLWLPFPVHRSLFLHFFIPNFFHFQFFLFSKAKGNKARQTDRQTSPSSVDVGLHRWTFVVLSKPHARHSHPFVKMFCNDKLLPECLFTQWDNMKLHNMIKIEVTMSNVLIFISLTNTESSESIQEMKRLKAKR